jgi:molecular chaperone DnaK
MKKDAELNAESDRIAKETADKVNEADSMIFQTEKQLGEFGEKLSEANKTAINLALVELKMAYEAKDVAAITPALEKINTAWTNASAEMYNTGDAQGAAPSEPQASGDTTQDVEFEEVK